MAQLTYEKIALLNELHTSSKRIKEYLNALKVDDVPILEDFITDTIEFMRNKRPDFFDDVKKKYDIENVFYLEDEYDEE